MNAPVVNRNMEYRRLGATGLKVSVLSFGSWVTFDTQLDDRLAVECMAAAGEAGCNFFDNAEAYAGGESEEIMGRALRALGWPRWSYVLTTKAYLGHPSAACPTCISRSTASTCCSRSKARSSGSDRLRRRLLLPPCRPGNADGRGVGTMSEIVSSGKAHYWGTSEWTADRGP